MSQTPNNDSDHSMESNLAALSLQPTNAGTPMDTEQSAPASAAGSAAAAHAPASSAPAPVSHAGFSAVLDIEDLHSVTICGHRRARPPIVPFLCPFRLHLEVGKTYRYCTCGRSEEQPWCDDSHLERDPQPIEFTVSQEQTWHLLCGCKYSLKQPFCDGSHIHAVDGYEEVSTVPVAPSVAAAATAAAPSSVSTTGSR